MISFDRRGFLRSLAGFLVLVGLGSKFPFIGTVSAQDVSSGKPLPDETVEATLKRLFGSRAIHPGTGKIKLELPVIAEDGGSVAVTIESDLPLSGASHLKSLYIIADKNRRPMLAKFSFTPAAGRAFVATSLRLAQTTDVRAIAEMSDGALYSVSRNVRVTISGCDLPPAG